MPKCVRYLAISLLLFGCHQNEESNSVSQENKQGKPIVAIVPISDNSSQSLSWNLSEELTYAICYKLEQKDRVFLVDPQKTRSLARKYQELHSPFSTDLRWVKRSFPHNEFVVFMELLEHKEVPISSKEKVAAKDSAAELNMKVRLRVIDVREENPKVVLQEIVQDTHFIPKQFNQYNFHQLAWGTEDFTITPLGIAHAQLTKEIASRIEDYVLLSIQE